MAHSLPRRQLEAWQFASLGLLGAWVVGPGRGKRVFVGPSILLYSLFATFAYYNRRSALEFQGSSKALRAFLSFMGFAGIGVGSAYLVWDGISISWIGCSAAFAAGGLCVNRAALAAPF